MALAVSSTVSLAAPLPARAEHSKTAPIARAVTRSVAASTSTFCQQLGQAFVDALNMYDLWGNDVDWYRAEYYLELGKTYCAWPPSWQI
jgi:hypothetical protein